MSGWLRYPIYAMKLVGRSNPVRTLLNCNAAIGSFKVSNIQVHIYSITACIKVSRWKAVVSKALKNNLCISACVVKKQVLIKLERYVLWHQWRCFNISFSVVSPVAQVVAVAALGWGRATYALINEFSQDAWDFFRGEDECVTWKETDRNK